LKNLNGGNSRTLNIGLRRSPGFAPGSRRVVPGASSEVAARYATPKIKCWARHSGEQTVPDFYFGEVTDAYATRNLIRGNTRTRMTEL
jgi:hypothetical protein